MEEPYPAETDKSGTITSFIALPTPSTPPSSCSTVFRLNGVSLVAYDPGFGIDIDTRVRCAPGAVTTWWEQGRLGLNDGQGHTAVSIGPLACPDRRSTVASSVKDDTSTLAMCCPPDYTLAHGISGSMAGNCQSDVLADAVLTFASTPITDRRAWRITVTTVETASWVGAIAVVGWTVATSQTTDASISSMSWGGSDFEAKTTTADQVAPTNPASTTSRPTSANVPAYTNPGLPLTTTVGVGVGAGVGVVALAGLAFFLCRKKLKQHRRPRAPPVVEALNTRPSPFDPDKYARPARTYELCCYDTRNISPTEMPVPRYYAELDSGMQRSR
ncbi:hypothetical protein C8035_v004146 [Colletotrichum spinosum]|uniref:Uncharacterized protein n=1 Tax=Colletotrichum spinosum TaxID=1347390 RepID=A0A4R8QSY2_9PEZI|nr:hypothetical protein C8035_v004146 [Colletotrichum spinosum]